MKHYSLLAFIFSLSIGFCQSPGLAQTQAEIEHYERKYISFYYPQNYPLNHALAQSFKKNFPRFDYHLASTSIDFSFEDFLKVTQNHQNTLAGELSAQKEVPDQRFGTQVITWSETQKIAQAAYVFVPHWSFDSINLEGPYPTDPKKTGKDWFLNANAGVNLEMTLFSLQDQSPREYERITDFWSVQRKKVLYIRGSDVQAAARKVETKKDPIDLSKSLSSSDRNKILKELKKNDKIASSIAKIEAQKPEEYMMSSAHESMGYASVISAVRRLQEFLIRAEVADANMETDQIEVTFGKGESVKSLGIKKDASYKVLEYLSDHPDLTKREIGWLKVRENKNDSMLTQAIIVERNFELGDQVIEYPKSGMGINLRGGAAFTPWLLPGGGGGALDLDLNIGPALNLSEWYLSFTGGYYAGQNQSSVRSSYQGVLLELGLQKKWFYRQTIFALGLRGGALFPEKSNQSLNAGFTALMGLHWQASPDFAYGLDAGWRQYAAFGGPILEGFIRFEP